MNRRDVLRLLLAGAATPLLAQGSPRLITRIIPSSGEAIPVIGLGSWITFNVGNDRVLRERSAGVIRAFLDGGGKVIDSSPMYGSSQDVIGEALAKIGAGRAFAADKVWIASGAQGPAQIEESRRHWRIAKFDLLEVHNLMAWEEHLPTLFAMKKAGRLRYVGVTTSHGRRHGELETIMRRERLDFVQFTYNPIDREPEERLLPLARERGIAVIVNRPFQQGDLVERLARVPLPSYARDLQCTSWAQIILKFIVAHPAVTCVIPATTVAAHAQENLAAARAPMPNEALRRLIARDIEKV